MVCDAGANSEKRRDKQERQHKIGYPEAKRWAKWRKTPANRVITTPKNLVIHTFN
jgi:BRCT domain type II-containing protein